MAGWPSIPRTHDQWLARSLVTGHPSALPKIYDAYAPRLFDYCHVLLRDEEAAGLALRAALLGVREHIGGLPDVRPFRGRLYAVTRGECMRRLADEGASSPGRPAAAEADGPETDEETRRLVRTALGMLDGRQREALDLAFRHELDPHDLAEVLSAPPYEVSTRVAQARTDLDEVFTVVNVAANGRDCPAVAAFAGLAGVPLAPEIYDDLIHHIADCPACRTRGAPTADTAWLLRAMPTAALPPALRTEILGTGSAALERVDPGPATMALAEQPTLSDLEDRRSSPYPWVALAVAVCSLFIAGGIFLVMPEGGQNTSGEQPIALPRDPVAGGTSPSDSARPSPSRRTPTPKPSTSSSSPSPTHSRTHRPAPPSPDPGRLEVFGCHIVSYERCSIQMTARGGPVTWRVTGTSASVTTGGSGTIPADHTDYLTVFRKSGDCSGVGSVSFSSGATVSVTWEC